MKTILLDLLICPACLPKENDLVCNVIERKGEDILTGSLRCGECGSEYSIEEGIAFLDNNIGPDNRVPSNRYEEGSLVSSYLWSHYSDLFNDRDALSSYKEWAELIKHETGIALDTGCSVGRFTFEMSERSRLAIGIDNSRSFIRSARKLMKDRELDFDFPDEGITSVKGSISLPEKWSAEKVEFIVADALRLPFPSHLFHVTASLNLIDKVPFPLKHLKEVNRVARKKGAQFLFSDPFSWSSDVAEEKEWLGGTAKGTYPGRGINNVRSLLQGKKGEISEGWAVEREGHVWWKIKNHRNHFELIRSCFIKAVR